MAEVSDSSFYPSAWRHVVKLRPFVQICSLLAPKTTKMVTAITPKSEASKWLSKPISRWLFPNSILFSYLIYCGCQKPTSPLCQVMVSKLSQTVFDQEAPLDPETVQVAQLASDWMLFLKIFLAEMQSVCLLRLISSIRQTANTSGHLSRLNCHSAASKLNSNFICSVSVKFSSGVCHLKARIINLSSLKMSATVPQISGHFEFRMIIFVSLKMSVCHSFVVTPFF